MTGSDGRKSRQQPGQRWHDDEVDHEQHGEEASVADHAAHFQQRHLGEGDVEQRGQHGPEQFFYHRRGVGHVPAKHRTKGYRDQIEENLAAFQLQARQHVTQCGEKRITQPEAITSPAPFVAVSAPAPAGTMHPTFLQVVVVALRRPRPRSADGNG